MRKQKTTPMEKAGEIKDSIFKKARSGKERVKRIAAIGATVGTAALVAAGCGTETHTFKDAKKVATTKYDHSFRNTSPAGKFLLQYLRVAYAEVVKHRGEGDSNYGVDSYYEFAFNNGCLGGTAYDIAGGEFRASAAAGGFFSSASAEVEGKVPSAAANAIVDSDQPDTLIIRSGHSGTPAIRFNGLEGDGPLEPAGKQTQDVLSTYGCETGMMGHQVIEGYPQGGDRALPIVHVE